jgi:hypothetical protein
MDADNMTNTQLYLVIGIPGLLSLVGILLNAALYINFSSTLNARMTSFETSINARIVGLESRIAALETRMLNLENTFTTRFDLLMGRLTDLEKEIHRGR